MTPLKKATTASLGGITTPLLAGELTKIAEGVRRWAVEVRGRRSGGGSGVIWRAGGLVVTNAHVIRGRETEVVLADGRAFDAAVVKRDDARDLAALILKGREGTEARDLPTATIGDSDNLRVGEVVLAIGNPFGISGAVAAGIVHTTGQISKAPRGGVNLHYARAWIEADVRLAPGNSGGPLVDARGRVVGINAMISMGLALAVPSNVVQRFLRGLERSSEAVRTPQLGVSVRPISVPLWGGPVLGLLVIDVRPGSMAEEAGLLIGDVLIGADGRFFTAPGDLTGALNDPKIIARSEDVLRLDLLRGGEHITRDVAVTVRASVAEAA